MKNFEKLANDLNDFVQQYNFHRDSCGVNYKDQHYQIGYGSMLGSVFEHLSECPKYKLITKSNCNILFDLQHYGEGLAEIGDLYISFRISQIINYNEL